jgi:hypothetical protein
VESRTTAQVPHPRNNLRGIVDHNDAAPRYLISAADEAAIDTAARAPAGRYNEEPQADAPGKGD